MNQMDEKYWQELAKSWIQNRQTTSQQIENPQIPNPPKISFRNPQNDDNSAIDMDIEEDVKEEQPAWNTQVYQNSNIQQQPQQQQQQQNAVQTPDPPKNILPNRHQHKHEPRKTFSSHHHHHHQQQRLPAKVPDPPVITPIRHNIVEEQLSDMDMDESDDNSNSSGNIDARKKKTLPIWIREGLEKMKREKEMESAREQEEQKAKIDEENRKKLMEEALKEIEQEKLRKSKYVSLNIKRIPKILMLKLNLRIPALKMMSRTINKRLKKYHKNHPRQMKETTRMLMKKW
jgi:hypothetical protein